MKIFHLYIQSSKKDKTCGCSPENTVWQVEYLQSKWDKEKLTEDYFADLDRVNASVGIALEIPKETTKTVLLLIYCLMKRLNAPLALKILHLPNSILWAAATSFVFLAGLDI